MRTDYTINSCGVCTNPDILLEYHDKDIEFKATAMTCNDGLLATGYSMESYITGAHSPVMPSAKHFSDIKHILRYFRSFLENRLTEETAMSNNARMAQISKAIKWVDIQLCPNKQLELF